MRITNLGTTSERASQFPPLSLSCGLSLAEPLDFEMLAEDEDDLSLHLGYRIKIMPADAVPNGRSLTAILL